MALRTHTKNILSGNYERQIIDAMARAMFVTTWADRMEERGLGHKLSGQKLMDIAPKTSRDALAAAKKLAAMFAEANEGASMNDLYARALNVAGKHEGDASPHSFGHYMAMEAMGHGVSWTDDHPEFKVNIPRFEYYPGRGAIKGMASGKAKANEGACYAKTGLALALFAAPHRKGAAGGYGYSKGMASSSKRVKKLPNGWTLSWFPERPNTVYVDDDKNGSWSDSALQARGKIAYDFPERVPDSVKTAVKSFFREVKRGMAGGYGYSKGMAYGNLGEQDLVKFKPAVERAKAKTHYKKIKRALDEGHAVSREDFAKAYEFESGRPYPHYKGRSKGKKPGCGCKGK